MTPFCHCGVFAGFSGGCFLFELEILGLCYGVGLDVLADHYEPSYHQGYDRGDDI